MHKLFVHNPFFRLLSPIFSGVIVYLLILLVNNNVEQLYNEFLGEELYICIGLSYLVQEVSRLQLLLVKYLLSKFSTLIQIILQILVALIISIILVTVSMQLYFDKILGFSVPNEELWLFNSIFCILTLFYILLYISHNYLYKINTEKLSQEELYKENIENDFKQFKQGINPELLFESLESLLILSKKDIDASDDFIDQLATVYRYILSSKKRQLVNFSEEFSNAENIIKVFNTKAYRNIKLESKISTSFLLVPTTLLYIIEQIVKSTIKSSEVELKIELLEKENFFNISFDNNFKINHVFNLESIQNLIEIYSIYTDEEIIFSSNEKSSLLKIPKLNLNTTS